MLSMQQVQDIRAVAPVSVPADRYRQYKTRLMRSMHGRRRRFWIAFALAVVTLGSGMLNIFSVMGGPSHPRFLRAIFPIEFIHLSRSLTLLIGFALVITSLNVLKRKRLAWVVAVVLAYASILFHLTKGLDYQEASVSAGLLIALLLSRKIFSVRSSAPSLRSTAIRLAVAVTVAIGYGVAGFWFLDERHFGINFHIGQAIETTFRLITFAADPKLIPLTGYGAWFLRSVYMMTVVALAYSGFALFRPVVYQYRTMPREHILAQSIAAGYSRTSLDYFKLWPDKSYFFSPSHHSFIAYRVARNVALALGDPVGPRDEVPNLVREFIEFCRENGWTVAFHQTLPEFLNYYRAAGLKRLKIGDDAVVDLTQYSLEGKGKKEFRYKVRQLEGMGISFVAHRPPLPSNLVRQLRQVSDEWLEIPGRRERTFTLGHFTEEYVASTQVFTATNASGIVLGFVNLIEMPNSKEVSLDLMRRRTDAPNGIMEYLFVKVFLWAREQGYEKFNLGMAPMSGFQEREEARPEERAIHSFFQQLNFLFSFRGLRQYKAKFATGWEPRYLIYSQATELPRVALALRRVSELQRDEEADRDVNDTAA